MTFGAGLVRLQHRQNQPFRSKLARLHKSLPKSLLPVHHWHACCNAMSRMTFAMVIGETEKNLLEFNFNQLLGSTVIKVNDKLVKKNTRLFSEPLKERHEFEVGQNERHTVFIEKQRKLLFGQKYLVYVNQRLVKLIHGV
jgi:hypothetical protein